MKFLQILTVSIAIVGFTSCGGGGDTHDHSAETAYHCPMDCEEGKTYSEEGTCPVCGMDLVVVE